MNSPRITVRKHAGHSGKSVFSWRVYREWGGDGLRAGRVQLAKAKTEEAADRVAAHYRERDTALAAK
jgi:hypothetical protein